MKNVLITALGTMNANAIIDALRAYDSSYHLIGADIYSRECIANSLFVDEFYQFPRADVETEKYIEYLLDFCKQHTIDVIYCVIDEEVSAIANRIEEFNALGTKVCIPNAETVNICHNKQKFISWLQTNMPNYCIRTYRTIGDVDQYPVFVKPNFGRASIGCMKINNKNELQEVCNTSKNLLIQEYLTGDIVAVDIVSNLKYNQVGVIQRKELLRNGNGCGVAVEIIDNKTIDAICREFVQKMQVNGVINIEFFVNGEDYKFIEVNPRLAAGTSFSCQAGLNTVINAMQIAQGEPCSLSKIAVGTHMARRYETYLI